MKPLAYLAALLLAVPLAAQTAAAVHHGLDPANLDTTCAPCTDFYRFANGGWIARTERPAEFPVWGSFSELQQRNNDAVRGILERLAQAAPARAKTDDEKLGAFYAACMDSAAIERLGDAPIRPELRRIAALQTPADVIAEGARLDREGMGALFALGGTPDFKNSSMTIATAGQGGLGLPDRDYYFRTDSATAAVRDAYVAHVARTLELLGDAPAAAGDAARRIMALETAIARVSLTRVQRRNPYANYHPMTLAAADSVTPHIDWRAFLAAAGAPATDTIDLGQPSFFHAEDSLLAAVPVADWRDYLRWHVANRMAPSLSAAFVNEAFSFESVLSGVKVQQPRWRRCLGSASFALGDVLGRDYVQRYFTPAARRRALDMVNNLIAALHDRLEALPWMSDSTRAQALTKLQDMRKKIGYPDKWRDYSGLAVTRGAYAADMMAAAAFFTADNLSRIGKPVDRTEWRMTTPTVNAYYNPSQNDINFPAGILQPPFFDPQADDAVNYGGMGAVIGHEMTHGFDDHGRQFDQDGNLRDWWTAADAAAFDERAQKIIDQFDGYTVVDSATHVNGRLTTGENIADLGGLKVAYAAFEKSLAGKPRPPLIDGETPEQRFFLAWAQIWRQTSTDQYLRNEVSVDPHAPARWRVIGPLSNLPEFAAAFHCRPGDPMVRPDSLRVSIW